MAKDTPTAQPKPRRFLLDLRANRIAAFEPLPIRGRSLRFITVEEVLPFTISDRDAAREALAEITEHG
jgi:hypothetical protein